MFFFLGFMGIAAATEESLPSTAVAASFGLGLTLAIFAFGHISGGHYNPAVTLGLAAGRQFPWKELPGYWFAQFIGGMAAVGLVTPRLAKRCRRPSSTGLPTTSATASCSSLKPLRRSCS
jgi:glycerol uptake facilitator-like aquaporin